MSGQELPPELSALVEEFMQPPAPCRVHAKRGPGLPARGPGRGEGGGGALPRQGTDQEETVLNQG